MSRFWGTCISLGVGLVVSVLWVILIIGIQDLVDQAPAPAVVTTCAAPVSYPTPAGSGWVIVTRRVCLDMPFTPTPLASH